MLSALMVAGWVRDLTGEMVCERREGEDNELSTTRPGRVPQLIPSSEEIKAATGATAQSQPYTLP